MDGNSITSQTTFEPKKPSFIDKFSYKILLLVTFLLPVFFLPISGLSTQFSTSLLFSFGVILAVVFFVVSTLLRGSLDLPRPAKYILGFTAVVPLVYALAGLATGFSRMDFFGYTFDISTIGFILLGFAYLFIVSLVFRDKPSIFYSYFAFLISAIIISIFVIIRMIWGADVLSFGVFTNITSTPIGSFNNLGIFFGIGALLSLMTYQMVRLSLFMKVLLTLALVSSLFFLALINFSLIWVILAVSSFLFILYTIFSLSEYSGPISFLTRLTKIPLYPSLVLVISIVFVIWSTTLGTFLSRQLSITNVEVRPNFSTTMEIAKNTIKAKPFFGSGPNTFVNQWLVYRPNDIITSAFWNTDFANGMGLIPTFAVTTGLLGVLSWLLFLGFYLYLGVKSIFVRIEDMFTKYLLVSSFFVSLYLWIMTFVYVPSTVIFILTLFFTGLFFASVYLAGLVSVETRVFSKSSITGFLASLTLVVAFIGSLALGYGLWKNSESLWYFQKSSYAINHDGDISASEQYMLKAIDAVPNDLYFRSLSQIEIIKLNEIVKQDPNKVKVEVIQQQFSDVLSNAIKASLAAKDVDPSNYLNWISLGQVYEAVSTPALKIEGAYESSKLAYTEALNRNPKNPAILVYLSRLAATKGDLKLAKQYANEAIVQKRNYLDAYFMLAQIEVSDNNIRGAIDSVAAATIIDPTNPAIFFQLGVLKYNLRDYAGAITALEKATSMTPDYANAKYFLGLAYEIMKRHEDAIKQFEDVKRTNPDNKDLDAIIANLKAGKSIFTDTTNKTPEKGKTLPVKEKVD